MAFQYAKLALAGAMMAAPAMAAPVPQDVVVTVTAAAPAAVTHMVYVDQNGNVIQGPEQQAAPSSTPAATSAAPSADIVQAAAVKPSHTAHQASSSPAPQTYAAAPKSSQAAASTAASKPTSSSSSSSGGSSSGGKKGLAYHKDSGALSQAKQIASSSNGGITWMYDWEGYPFINGQGSTGFEVDGVEFVPMLHDTSDTFTGPWKSGSPGPQGKGAKHALFINEPDHDSTHCDESEAADVWKNTFAPGASGAKLGGPATTGSTGGPWIKNFLKSCSDCEIDFFPYHYYAATTDVGAFQKAVSDYHDIVQKPLWITEFGLKAVKDGGNFSAQQRADFIEAASKWMDGQDFIERYAPYQVATDGSNDELTTSSPITKQYVSA